MSQTYRFKAGLPAFESYLEFQVVERAELEPLLILCSVQEPPVRFVCVPAEWLVADYSFQLSEEDAVLLGWPESTAGRQISAGREPDLRCLLILEFREGGGPHANLGAPVLLCTANGRGVQSIQIGDAYPHRFPIDAGGREKSEVNPCSS